MNFLFVISSPKILANKAATLHGSWKQVHEKDFSFLDKPPTTQTMEWWSILYDPKYECINGRLEVNFYGLWLTTQCFHNYIDALKLKQVSQKIYHYPTLARITHSHFTFKFNNYNWYYCVSNTSLRELSTIMALGAWNILENFRIPQKFWRFTGWTA